MSASTEENVRENAMNNIELIVYKIFEIRSLEVILRLKNYLKIFYFISDDKCLSFSPDDKVIFMHICME
jgi:hypothetical protein